MFRMLVDEDAVIIFLSGFSVADYPLRESLFPTLKSGPLERIVFGMKYVSPPQGMPLSAAERRALPGEKGTVVPASQQDNPISNHLNTWRIAYNIEGIRAWLFEQRL
jgi:hypothetical protein